MRIVKRPAGDKEGEFDFFISHADSGERKATKDELSLIEQIRIGYLVGYDNGYHDDIVGVGLDADGAADLYFERLLDSELF